MISELQLLLLPTSLASSPCHPDTALVFGLHNSHNPSQACTVWFPGFDACIKGGVKLFDTAEIYGPGRSEAHEAIRTCPTVQSFRKKDKKVTDFLGDGSHGFAE